jgi:hypothetical protein
MVVYIPTLSRLDNLRKIIPYWLEQEMQVRLVVEHREYGAHNALKRDMGWGSAVYILPLPLDNRGIGYSRNYCVKHASRTALDSIIMSDDDIYVNTSSDAWLLLDEAAKPGVLGVGGALSIHDRFTDGAISRTHGAIMCPGGWAFKLYGLNVQVALDCGNYNRYLHSHGEDAEMARQGISRGYPWRVHCDVRCTAIGKRYDPGGLAAKYTTKEKRIEAEHECMAIIHNTWPKYTNAPDKPSRTAWQKMLNDYIPTWREASALHGGSLDKLWE